MRAFPWFAVAALLMAPVRSAHAQMFLEGSAGLTYDSNLPRAQNASDIKSDSALVVAASGGRAFEAGDNTSVALSADAKSVTWLHYPGLSHTDLGATLAWRSKFGLGLYAPWARLSASAARMSFGDSLRNGWRYDAGLTAGKRLTPNWDVRADIRYDKRSADRALPVVPSFSGAVYDVHGWTASVASQLALGERLQVSLAYARRTGDITSTAVHTQAIWNASTAWNKDRALGGDGYRIHARTQMLTLGASYALGKDSSLNLEAERWLSRANGGFDYYNSLVRAGVLVTFF